MGDWLANCRPGAHANTVAAPRWRNPGYRTRAQAAAARANDPRRLSRKRASAMPKTAATGVKLFGLGQLRQESCSIGVIAENQPPLTTPVEEIFADSVLLGELRFVSLSWLRKLRAVANRHKDLDDLEHLPPA